MFCKKVKKTEKAKKQTKKCFCIIKQKGFYFLFNISKNFKVFFSAYKKWQQRFIKKPERYATLKSTWKTSKSIWKRNRKCNASMPVIDVKVFFKENKFNEKEKKNQ